MTAAASPDVVVYVCHRSVPSGASVRRQWMQDGARVVLHLAPCSGKMDGQYLLHAMEGGACGLCIVACPKGECHLNQGNYRAEIRVRTLRRLLGEIGLEPERAEFLHSSQNDPPEHFDRRLREAVARICALGESPLRAGQHPVTAEYPPMETA